VTPDYAFLNGIKLFSNTEIFVRNLSTGHEVPLTEIPPEPENSGSFRGHPAFSPDGRTIAFTKWYPNEADCTSPFTLVIYLMDASGRSIGPVTCDPEQAWLDAAASWSPDGQEIAFTRRWDRNSSIPYEQLYKVSVSSKAITKLTDSDGAVYSELTPAWSSDGKAISIGSNWDGDFDIWRVSPMGSGYLNNLTDANSDIDGFPAYMK
jgi:Tol biopolymer transport system component